jgi:hypothetical protein
MLIYWKYIYLINLQYIIYIVRPFDLILRHEGVWRNGNKTPHILNIRITIRQLVGFRPRSLYFRVRIVAEGLTKVSLGAVLRKLS